MKQMPYQRHVIIRISANTVSILKEKTRMKNEK
jgi:hypothetical protein